MKLLFVCTGNTCRSPMAQALCEKILSEKGISAECASAGVAAIPGQNISQNAVLALAELFGIENFSHKATPLTREMIENADLVIAMTENHRLLVCQKLGDQPKIITMPSEVGDPFGGDLAHYEMSAKTILAGLEKLMEEGVIHD